MAKLTIAAVTIATLAGCSGLNQNKEMFASHAESVNILFLQVPGDTMERANMLVPENAEIKTINSTPSDTSSVLGVLNRIFGIEIVSISGEMKK
ncbi:tRNA modification GTPase [Aliivibrio finisterrensis]|uniref:tRNA modification GTPase n=1 Tax=Aliivibrio finisterrensis TaxID=511998 RepID=A0A6N6RVF4_9GAMM|nr:tRNA modification GTPase [Aliivibrio finisterrensis]